MTNGRGDSLKHCGYCAKVLQRKRYNGRLEDNGSFRRRKYCDRKCMAKMMEVPFPGRPAWAQRARRLRKTNCEKCGATETLAIHHRNRKWWDNRKENIGTLCASCHTTLHHASGDIVPRKAWRHCRHCGYLTYGRSVCNTCRTQIKRHGKPHPEKTKKRRSLRQPDKL